ncbi:hypothetical protein [Isoptericola sp. NPDC055881]
MLYGMLLGALAAELVLAILLKTSGALYLGFSILCFVVTSAVLIPWGMVIAWSINDRLLRKSDPYYGFGRTCRGLIDLRHLPPKELGTRETLCRQVDRYFRESESRLVAVGGWRAGLENVCDRSRIRKRDLDYVHDAGEESVVRLLRGGADVRMLSVQAPKEGGFGKLGGLLRIVVRLASAPIVLAILQWWLSRGSL